MCVNLRPQSPEGQWEPKVLWVPAGEAEKGRDREEGRRKESAGQTWRSEKTLQRPSAREEEIWNAMPGRGNQTGEQNILNIYSSLFFLYMFYILSHSFACFICRHPADRADCFAVTLTTTATRCCFWLRWSRKMNGTAHVLSVIMTSSLTVRSRQ